jgi:ornithine cyclodeaminase
MRVTVLSEAEIRSCVTVDREAMAAVAEGFTRLAEGRTVTPPVTCVEIPEHDGEVDIKTAYVEGLESFAVKIASGFFSNPAKGLPYGSGVMILISAETGIPQALLADNGYLTEVRTGLAGAIAAEHLAPTLVDTVGVVGSGSQARYQMRGLSLARDFRRILVYGIVANEVQDYADEMERELGVTVVVSPTVEKVVRESDVLITTTPAREPFVEPQWLHRGLHITAMGADAPYKRELFSGCLGKADLVVCDRLAQCRLIGETHHALDAGDLREDQIVELGQITAGLHPGRSDDRDITICDLTGVGVQDTAIARLAFSRAAERGLGTVFDS